MDNANQKYWKAYANNLQEKMMSIEHLEQEDDLLQISKKSQTLTSNKCPYGLCDGSGMVLSIQIINDKPYDVAGPCKCYEERIQSNMLKFAMIPEAYKDLTVNSFDTSLYDENNMHVAIKAKNIAAKYVMKFDEMERTGKGLFLHSKQRGSGKTRLIVSIGNALIKRYKQRTRFITTLDLLGKIKETYEDDSKYSEQKLIVEFCEIPILILDDIGTEKTSAWVTEVFYRILDTRETNHKVTLITSNLSIDELNHDNRIKSRLKRMCIEVNMPEQDIRNKLGKAENEELINMLLSS